MNRRMVVLMLLQCLRPCPKFAYAVEVLLKYPLWNILEQVSGHVRRVEIINVRHEEGIPLGAPWIKYIESGMRMRVKDSHL